MVRLAVQLVCHSRLPESLLLRFTEVALRLLLDVQARSLSLFHLRRHVLPRAHLHAPLRELSLSLLALRLEHGVNANELRLGHLLGVRRVVAHEHEFLEVRLLGVQRSLERTELVVEPDALLSESLDDLLVRFSDALRLVVFDESLVEPVLEQPKVLFLSSWSCL